MRTICLHLWSRLRTSFWFVPGGLVLLAAATGYAAIAVDRQIEDQLLSSLPSLRDVSAAGVRSLLSTAATSVLTLTGVTFSATLVALTLASSQYGGRLLRNFIRSVPNQLTLGVLLGTFVLCLIILRSVRSVADGEFIPHVAALLAFASTLGSLAMFIYFIHHIAVSLQADHIVAQVYGELECAIEDHFPDARPDGEEEREAGEDKLGWESLDAETALTATRSGYVQAVDASGLLEICERHDLRCRVIRRPGQFVQEGSRMLAIGGEKASGIDGATRSELLNKVIVGRVRTAEQDFEFCLRQLVEVALRALSPGINDPYTAMNCIDFLGAGIARAAKRSLPERVFYGGDGTPRVQVRPVVFTDLLETAFNQIRQVAGDRTDIAIRLLDALAEIGEQAPLAAHREEVKSYAELVASKALGVAEAECDRIAVQLAHDRVANARR